MCLLTLYIHYLYLNMNSYSTLVEPRGRPTVNQVMWTLKLLALTDRLYRTVHWLQLVIGVGHCVRVCLPTYYMQYLYLKMYY